MQRLFHATGYSLAGLRSAYRHEKAFRLEVHIATLLLPLSFFVGQGWQQVLLLAGSVWLVLIIELLNSAIEAVVDRVSLDLHELSKRAKDMGSAAVLLAVVLAAGVWLTVLWGRLH